MFADPVKNLKMLELREDMILADLGAGSGFFAMEAARMLPQGKVYAVEVQRDFVKSLQNKAKDNHIQNLEVFWGDIEKKGGTKLKDGLCDRVIISNALFQAENKDDFLAEAKRITKPGGKMLFIDFHLPKKEALALLHKHGFALEREVSEGERHYGMILKRV